MDEDSTAILVVSRLQIEGNAGGGGPSLPPGVKIEVNEGGGVSPCPVVEIEESRGAVPSSWCQNRGEHSWRRVTVALNKSDVARSIPSSTLFLKLSLDNCLKAKKTAHLVCTCPRCIPLVIIVGHRGGCRGWSWNGWL